MADLGVEDQIKLNAQTHAHYIAKVLQAARIVLIVLITAVWLIQTLFITWHAAGDPKILNDIEKFIALITGTGALSTLLVMKLWPQNKED